MVTVQITISRGLAPFRKLSLDRLRPVISRAAARYRLDPALIAAIIKAESAFDPKAVSWAGARGLMQLMPNTARHMGVKDSFDPEQNVMGGARYLREMLDRFGGDLTLAVAAYNCGPERVARAGRVPDISETRNYVRTVKANLEMMGPLFTASEASGKGEEPAGARTSYVLTEPVKLPDATGAEAALGSDAMLGAGPVPPTPPSLTGGAASPPPAGWK
ncbi:MAG: lytic transglycosylase domain-containing protein [Deltaproteobacteria bacterium]|nr:lytic transglycosylase domain-containing protein [Deltaproteobacteria bacterium]